MQISVNNDTNGVLVLINGEMDALGCADARNTLEHIAEQGQGQLVIVDLSGVTFLDSSGIGAIVFLFKRLRASGGDLNLCNITGQPRELLELLRIDKAIHVDWESNHEARAAS